MKGMIKFAAGISYFLYSISIITIIVMYATGVMSNNSGAENLSQDTITLIKVGETFCMGVVPAFLITIMALLQKKYTFEELSRGAKIFFGINGVISTGAMIFLIWPIIPDIPYIVLGFVAYGLFLLVLTCCGLGILSEIIGAAIMTPAEILAKAIAEAISKTLER